jgi:hypothetical protein
MMFSSSLSLPNCLLCTMTYVHLWCCGAVNLSVASISGNVIHQSNTNSIRNGFALRNGCRYTALLVTCTKCRFSQCTALKQVHCPDSYCRLASAFISSCSFLIICFEKFLTKFSAKEPGRSANVVIRKSCPQYAATSLTLVPA